MPTLPEDDSFLLAPIEEEEIGLAPIEDEPTIVIAPDFPFDTQQRLIPVVCSACKTRMYATEDQVGMYKVCPDCFRKTEIRAVDPEFLCEVESSEEGGYIVKLPELEEVPRARHDVDYRTVEGTIKPQFVGDRYIEEQSPFLERMLDSALKSDEEKSEESRAVQFERKIEKEAEAVKTAAQGGKLEEYIAGTKNDPAQAAGPAARRLAERERLFNAVASTPATASPPPRPARPAESKVGSAPQPPPIPNPTPVRKRPNTSLLSPLFDHRFRPRLIVLCVCGLLGNFFGAKAGSMIWQVLIDEVYGQGLGYSYDLSESGFFLISFWVGVALTVVWLTMLFLFGINLFWETAAGKRRVERWGSFDLGFGFSYFFWTLLILFLSGYPGFLAWQGIGLLLPTWKNWLILLLFFGQFLCFPILFLCLIGSETFVGVRPRKTLASLRKQPGLWLRFYLKTALVVAVPSAVLFGLFFLGAGFADYEITQTHFYNAVAAILLTFCGFFILLYFRLLGQAAWEIREQ